MPFCSKCGAEVTEGDSFCKRCGARLPTPAPAREAPSPPEEAPPPPARDLLSWTRLAMEGVGLSIVLCLFLLFISVFVSKDYVLFGKFYIKPLGWVWVAIIAVGAAWAAKEAREQGFLVGGLTGGVVGLLYCFIELAFFGAALISVRYLLSSLILGVSVGMFSGLFSGILGSPVMVRFPLRQKKMAMALLALLTFLGVVTLSLPGSAAEEHFNLGLKFFQKGMFPTATREFESAAALDPYMETTRNNLGLCYLEMGRIEEALKEWRTAKFLNLAFLDPRQNLIITLAMLGRVDELDEELSGLADFYIATDEETREEVKRFIKRQELAPHFSEKLALLASLALEQKNETTARVAAKGALDFNPLNRKALDILKSLEERGR